MPIHRYLWVTLLGVLLVFGPGCPGGAEECTDPDGCDDECTNPDGCDEECTDPDGCDDPDPPLPGDLEVTIHGRLERGAIISAVLTRDDEELATGVATWSVEPSDAALVLEDDRFQLLHATTVTLTAEVDDSVGQVQFTVAAPPTVVFQRYVDMAWRLYRVDLDGEGLEPILFEGDGREPTSSAGFIVFVSDRDGIPALYSVSLFCVSVVRLTELDAEHSQPAFDPDGAALSFIRLEGGIPKTFVSAADGADARRLTVGLGAAGTVEASPSFSPNGSAVVLSATPDSSPDLFVVDVETGAVTPLLTGAASHIEPAWSPCGRYVAFAANIDLETQLDLYLVDLDSGDVRRLTDRAEMDAQPQWLSDGRLVYAAAIDGGSELRWMDPDDPAAVHAISTGPERARAPVELR